MNVQFARQALMEDDVKSSDMIAKELLAMGADAELIKFAVSLLDQGLITPERVLQIADETLMPGLREDGGGSATGGGVTNGATFTPGTGMQYTTKKKVKEDAPRLAAGKIEDPYAVSHFGFKKAPAGGKDRSQIKGIQVKDLWSENYSRFKKETATRTKAQQMHEATKVVEKKLREVNKILEYTSQLRGELFETDGTDTYSHHTAKLMEKITKEVAEAYTKIKKIKQYGKGS